ncbi:hypothetical protein [Nonomuraea dietziae]|uniref:Uncharacterized protein n=1 Tax=Nonomuraea dietziae TaxID=65515 RepID=A0A7W5VAP3_9ACTN|nr:hypothetical protein [Nonomuraea dietziae]MBB3733767.1 hypothetical protein [Nonomuraea dietziae]
MPTTSELDALAKRRTRSALVGIGVLALIVAAAVVGLLSREPAPLSAGPQASSSPTPTQPSAGPTAPAASTDPYGYVRPTRWAQLPESSAMLADRYPVRFARTPAGAASAAAALYQASWTLDAAAAVKAVQVYIAPAGRAATREEALQGVAWFRQQIGVDAQAGLPPEASILVQPTGVRWTSRDGDNIIVNLNLQVDLLASRDQPVISASGAVTVHMRWHPDVRDGDWLAVRTPADQMPTLRYAELGSADFNQLGWSAIRPSKAG